MRKRMMPGLRLLPVLVLVSFLSFTVRVGEFWSALRHAGEASAQEKVNAEPPPLPPVPTVGAKPAAPSAAKADAAAPPRAATGAPEAKIPGAGADARSEPAAPRAGDEGEKADWRDASEDEAVCSDTQEQLNRDLSKRREQLDKEDQDLRTRKALLDAAQKELDQKLGEMTNLRNEIQGMMGQLSDEEKARIGSLVKIYEGMKPADAARIFNTLDMDVLIEVMGRMSERKTSPILAAMESERAKTVTIMLAQQKKVPDMPPAGQ